MTAETHAEFLRLLSALCDSQLTDAEQARLEDLLQADAHCRRLYLEYVDLHARLLIHPGLLAGQIPSVGEGEESATANRTLRDDSSAAGRRYSGRGRRRFQQAIKYGMVAAGTLAASLLVQALLLPTRTPEGGRTLVLSDGRPPEYVATLTQAAGCVWENLIDPRRVGSRLSWGELRLRQGVARIRFDGGADLMVEGPAVVRLDSSTAATVLRGKVVFRADKMSAPFDLHTPSSTLVDLGTEFAVAVGPEGEEIHVFDGEVQRTPRILAAEPEQLKAGEARRYGRSPASPGQPTALDPERFVRQLADPAQPAPDPAAGLLAYDGFDYKDRDEFQAGKANGGLGWAGPWTPGFVRPLNEKDHNLQVLNSKAGLGRPGAAVPPVGGCFDYAGFTKYFRRLTTPVRLDSDGVYYFSFLFRRDGPSDHEVNAVAVLLWTADEYELAPQGKDDTRKRLNIGVRGWNQLFTQLHDVGSRTPLPLRYGETYLLVAKVVASAANPDQVFMRVYEPDEPIESEEPGSWSVVGPQFQSDLVFDWLQLHINSKARQTIDEIRLGSTWSSVTAPWIGAAKAKKEGKP